MCPMMENNEILHVETQAIYTCVQRRIHIKRVRRGTVRFCAPIALRSIARNYEIRLISETPRAFSVVPAGELRRDIASHKAHAG